MKTVTRSIALSATLLISSTATAQLGRPAPAPDTLIMAGSNNWTNGASSNFQSMMIQLLDEYYAAGPCEAANNWATCDDLRFGFAINAGRACADTGAQGPLTWFYTPDEDAGIDVKARIQGIHNERGSTYCGVTAFVNHDTGLLRAWEKTFRGTTKATFSDLTGDSADPDDNGFWTRPHLNFFAVKDLPQSADGSNGGRVKRSLQQACDMYEGLPVVDDNGTATSTDDIVLGDLPSMPTWVLVERSANSEAHIYGGMLSAAGGTGACQIKQGGNWVDLTMCSYVRGTVSEATLRGGIADGARNNPPNGAYRCGPSSDPKKSAFSTGGLAASNLPAMRCHLSGEAQGQCNGGNQPTDLLGTFRCVRQLPFGITAPPPGPDNDYVIRYCPNGIPSDILDPSCIILRESQGDLQFVDDKRTLFIITNKDNCAGGDVETFECPLNEPCDTGGVGRCADGTIVCPDGQPVCKPAFEDYPEICNGLDDDCDGKVDNITASWKSPLYANYSLPQEHEGKDCNLVDVCFCPGGGTDLKAGSNFSEYLDSWGGACQCGEGLEGGFSALPDDEPMTSPMGDSNSACSAVADDSVPLSFVALSLLGFIGLVRRRRN